MKTRHHHTPVRRSMPDQAQPIQRSMYHGPIPSHPDFAGGFFNVIAGLQHAHPSICHILSPVAQWDCQAGFD
ncbi:hypothetical protein LPN04_08230 [Rugamonas sp. A1-17]|nr:hypothetical protein [Rugamonas sp. A1-17]